jgi:hypothetical protein
MKEKEFFLTIWQEREHYSEISNQYLGEEPLAFFFSHLLPKSTFPEARLDKDNIVFMTLLEHQFWEFAPHQIENDPRWRAVFEKRDALRDRYRLKKFKNNCVKRTH